MTPLVALPGDGVGREVMALALEALAQLAPDLSVAVHPCGGQHFLETGSEWSEAAARACASADAILLGAVGHPDPAGGGPVRRADGELAGYEAVLGNRRRRGLYANLRPLHPWPGVRVRLAGRMVALPPDAFDVLLVRENTEGLYAGQRARRARGRPEEEATDLRVISRRGSERVVRRAFALAEARSGRISCVGKPNVLEGCRLFAEVFDQVASQHPKVRSEHWIADAFGLALLQSPERFDVVVTTNLIGDLMSDVGAALVGGLGLAASANLGDDAALFEPVHGSAPDIAGTGRANPSAMLEAAGWCLQWLGARQARPGWVEAGDRLRAALRSVLAEGAGLTPDLDPHGGGTTQALGRAIIARALSRG